MAEQFEATAGRLDVVVADRLSLSRADAQRAIAGGRVRVDGAVRSKSHRLAGGELVSVDLAGMGDVPPEGPPVEIRHRDPYLVIVSKPAGMPTHPTAGRLTGTLVNRLVGMGLPLSSAGGPLRPGIVHRLDAGTSGLLIVASTDQAHVALTEMFRQHEVDRRYLALVRGAVAHDRFAVDAPLGRVGSRILVRAVTGKEAETQFEVRDRFDRATLLTARPMTGRTHQIRVHLAAVGHPVLGDRTYGGGGDDAKRLGLTRPFLHSLRLSLEHPISSERIEVEDALPPDLVLALRRVGEEG